MFEYWVVCILYFKSLPCSNRTWILRQIVQYFVALHSISVCSSDCIRRHLGKPEFVIIELLALHRLLKSMRVQESLFILKV